MAKQSFPIPSPGQLQQFAADARMLLDAGRFPRAYALATLALEELGKRTLCLEMLAGKLTESEFRRAWSRHPDKLERAHLEAVLSSTSEERIFAHWEDDAVWKMRGLYVDANPTDPDGAPLLPSDIGPDEARGIVETAETAAAGRWGIVLDEAVGKIGETAPAAGQ